MSWRAATITVVSSIPLIVRHGLVSLSDSNMGLLGRIGQKIGTGLKHGAHIAGNVGGAIGSGLYEAGRHAIKQAGNPAISQFLTMAAGPAAAFSPAVSAGLLTAAKANDFIGDVKRIGSVPGTSSAGPNPTRASSMSDAQAPMRQITPDMQRTPMANMRLAGGPMGTASLGGAPPGKRMRTF